MENFPEIWKVCRFRSHTLPDYEVSSLGNVRRCTGPHAGRVRRGWVCPGGYLRLNLRMDGVKRNQGVHQLVACTFLGPMPEGAEVDHIDRNRLNNRVENLRYCSRKENQRNRRDRDRLSFGAYFGNVKITSGQAARIRAILEEGG